METFIALIVVGVLMCVYGAFVFAGNVKCFSILAGGNNFLALNPSEAQYRREARRSGVAIFLLAIDFWCFGAWSYAQQDDAHGVLGHRHRGGLGRRRAHRSFAEDACRRIEGASWVSR